MECEWMSFWVGATRSLVSDGIAGGVCERYQILFLFEYERWLL